MSVLSVRQLSKQYGRVQALREVSFEVPEGSVFGILGPNGSGKTTLLGIVLDILKPTSGEVFFNGKAPSHLLRKNVGTLLETPNFYHYLSGERNLAIAAEIKGKGQHQIDAVLEQVNLLARKKSSFQTYSLGMKQRLAIASALLGNPDVLILDEPTNGLDPVGIAEIRDLIKKLAATGKTIIMASHLLDEVEKVCTHVAILKSGTLITAGAVAEVLQAEDIAEVGASDMKALTRVLQGRFPTVLADGGIIQLKFPAGTADLAAINTHCFEQGVVLNHLQLKKKSLETKFLELTNA